MKLTSLKQSFKDWNEVSTSEKKDDYYPCLYLEGDSLDAMGIDNLRVGTELQMVATVRVQSATDNKGGSRSMSFEIIDAAMEPKKADKEASSILFPNG
jgi:hypothetical protein